MRTVLVLTIGVVLGMTIQAVTGPSRDIVSLNHVAIAVPDFEPASRVYSQTFGFPQAFAFREPDGSPRLSYFQINRSTFIELMPVTAERPAGFVHFGLEVSRLDGLVARLRAAGLDVRDPAVSSRTNSRIAVVRTPQGTVIELLEFGPDSLHRKVMNAWKER